MKKYRVANRTNLPVNLDELSLVVPAKGSIIVDSLTNHLVALRSSRIVNIVPVEVPVTKTTETSSDEVVTRRRRSSSGN